MSNNYLDQFIIPDKTDLNLDRYIIPIEVKNTTDDYYVPTVPPYTPHEISKTGSLYPLNRFGYNLTDSFLAPVKLAENVALKISDLFDTSDENVKKDHENQLLWKFAQNDFTLANSLPKAEDNSEKLADFLGSTAGNTLSAYSMGIGSGATALGKSILEKTGGSLLGKAVAAGADNALLNLPQNVVNGLAKSEDPADAVKNIGTSELMDFTAGGLLGGVSSALLKPVKALGEAADDSAIDAILKNATKVDQTANTVYNEGIGKELPDALRFGNLMEGTLSDAKAAELLPESIGELGGAAKSDSAVDELWNDATKTSNVLNEGAGDLSGPVEITPPPNATEEQIVQTKAYIDGSNQALKAGKLSPTGRVSTAGSLRIKANASVAKERARAAAAGTPYRGHVGHVPDTTWTGNADPFSWLDLDPSVNMSIGGQANRYPLGYKPTEFRFRDR